MILQNKKVNLFEFPEYKENLTDFLESKTLIASGALEGEATLEVVTGEIHEVMDGVDTVLICTQAWAHDRAAVD